MHPKKNNSQCLNYGKDKNLSPYAFTKAKNLELLENLKKWFGMKFEVIYFYNVYGPRHIKSGEMATVIGIFEDLYNDFKDIENGDRRATQKEMEAWRQHFTQIVSSLVFTYKKLGSK